MCMVALFGWVQPVQQAQRTAVLHRKAGCPAREQAVVLLRAVLSWLCLRILKQDQTIST